jgi:hypothetical protein
MAAAAAEGMVGRAAEWTSWRRALSGGMEARNGRLEVRAWDGGASWAAGTGAVAVVKSVVMLVCCYIA